MKITDLTDAQLFKAWGQQCDRIDRLEADPRKMLDRPQMYQDFLDARAALENEMEDRMGECNE